MKKTILIIILLIGITSFSQKMKVLTGNIKNLKGITQYDLEFDYSNVGIPNYKSEEAFLKAKVALREKKEKGLGEKFRTDWFANRKKTYEPMFIKSFNKWFNKKEETISSKADYTIHIKITNLYTGYNVVAVNQFGKISAIITIFKKDAPNSIIFKGELINVKGGKSYELSKRIAVSYFNLAKNISLYIKRKSK